MNNIAHIQQKAFSLEVELINRINGQNVYSIYFNNGKVFVSMTNIGCSIVSIETPDKDGVRESIVAGLSNITDYLANKDYMGCVVGRYANRIAYGKFSLNNQEFQLPVNNALNHLHGGVEGFHKKIWEVHDFIRRENEVGVVFKYLSKDGEEGYPGNLEMSITYFINEHDCLNIKYTASTDKPTPVNLTNHTYFNLTGFKIPVVDDHLLLINSDYFTEKNEQNLPTGNILPVSQTPLDFRKFKRIGDDMDKFPFDLGYDHNFVLESDADGSTVFAAKLYEPIGGRVVNVYTTKPGMQVYTANYWDGKTQGTQGKFYQKHGAIALETQAFPDSPNHPAFPDTILYPGKQYASKTIYEFGIEPML